MQGKHSLFRPRWLLSLLVLSLLAGAQAGQTQIAPPLTNVFSFTDSSDGAIPSASLIQGKDGNFYGTTQLGANGYGTVFRLTMPPIVHSFFQAHGPVGTSVTLIGNNFTETTHVLVGTLYASFAINSDTSLSVLIPSGAVTSKITLVNPFGKGFNATPFTVTP